MMKFPATCDSLPILQGWEVVRELHSDDRSKVCLVRNAAGSESALKWVHLPPASVSTDNRTLPEAQQLIEELCAMRALSALPQITAVQDHAVQVAPDGSVDAFIRMELLTPLAERIASQPFTADDALRLTTDAAHALKQCHDAGIVHGNIKPANLLCAPNGYKLSDLGAGLGRLRSTRGQQGATCFQPPEQRRHQPESPQWDVYGLGMTLYVLFNGGLLPFQTKPGHEAEQAALSRCQALDAQPDASFPAPRHAPAPVAEVIAKAVAIQPEKRYPTPIALAEALAQAVGSLPQADRRAPLPMKQTAPARKAGPKLPIALIAVVVVILIAAAAVVPSVLPPVATPTPTVAPTPVPMTVSAIPGVTSAALTISDARTAEPAIVRVCVTGTDKGFELVSEESLLTLTGLAPATTYTVSVSAGGESAQTSFTTQPAAGGRFTPGTSRAFTVEPAWLTRYTANEMALTTSLTRHLNRLTSQELTLSALPLSQQNTAILASWSAAMAGDASLDGSEEATNLLVLRTANDVIAQIAPVTQAAFDNLRYYHDFTPLFEAYYLRHGVHPSGEVTLETYWLEELVGSITLTVAESAP